MVYKYKRITLHLHVSKYLSIPWGFYIDTNTGFRMTPIPTSSNFCKKEGEDMVCKY